MLQQDNTSIQKYTKTGKHELMYVYTGENLNF